MCATITGISDAGCRAPSLLPGWSRGQVLTHWARNADGQCRMLAAAKQGVIAEQYPGGNTQRGCRHRRGRYPARAGDRRRRARCRRTGRGDVAQHAGQRLARPTAASAGRRPAWMSVWARWRETDIHHVDLDLGYTYRHWPAEFTGLLLPRLLAGLDQRLPGAASIRDAVRKSSLEHLRLAARCCSAISASAGASPRPGPGRAGRAPPTRSGAASPRRRSTRSGTATGTESSTGEGKLQAGRAA
jgi:uncharacterized protein (TIGR03083 family)